MRIAIITLGCKVNQSESSSIEGMIREHDHEIVHYNDKPDVCVINTCTVTAKSDYQSRQYIRRAVKSGARVIATGCYAQLKPEELSNIKGLDLIVGNSGKQNIHEYLYKPALQEKTSEKGLTPEILIDPPEKPMLLKPYYSDRSRAFLKIQDGCNFSCSYCAVPIARGKSRSLKPVDVLKSADNLIAQGYKEIVFTGIHIGSYGLELKPETSLYKIVKLITGKYPLIRFRLSSIEPQELKKDFLQLIKDGNLCPHLHIPLQSGSDNILNSMNRGYSASFFKKLLNDIILICPHISIGTDIIVGFPGESSEDFHQTISLLETLPISYMHVFPYSLRQNTVASTLSGQIGSKTKKERVSIISEIAKKKKKEYITMCLGHTLDIIVEKKILTGGFYRAIAHNYIRPLVKAEGLIPGQRLHAKAAYFIEDELICIPE